MFYHNQSQLQSSDENLNNHHHDHDDNGHHHHHVDTKSDNIYIEEIRKNAEETLHKTEEMSHHHDYSTFDEPDIIDNIIKDVEPAAGIIRQRPTSLERPINNSFHYNKMHMGLKNLSLNVGAAVTPTTRMEFNLPEKDTAKHHIEEMEHKIDHHNLGAGITTIEQNSKILSDNNMDDVSVSSGGSDRSHLTEQGFLDLKFFHNKLW